MKSASSAEVERLTPRTSSFAWQSGYAIFSVEASNVSQLRSYLQRQKEHHADHSLKSEWEPSFVAPHTAEAHSAPRT